VTLVTSRSSMITAPARSSSTSTVASTSAASSPPASISRPVILSSWPLISCPLASSVTSCSLPLTASWTTRRLVVSTLVGRSSASSSKSTTITPTT
ncbi:hypothetical protein FOZ63_033441, partial [Perkinsus olseni]